jgi:hypothetical protein
MGKHLTDAQIAHFRYAEFDFGAWQGVLVPAGTPPAIVREANIKAE